LRAVGCSQRREALRPTGKQVHWVKWIAKTAASRVDLDQMQSEACSYYEQRSITLPNGIGLRIPVRLLGSTACRHDFILALPLRGWEANMIVNNLNENPTAVFDQDKIAILGGALDDAWKVVEANPTEFKEMGNSRTVQDVLAKHIIEMARAGELDSRRLAEGTLLRLKR
jgi:hypothetical protein